MPRPTSRPTRLQVGAPLRDTRLSALDRAGWHVRGGFTAALRFALRDAGHDTSGLPSYKFCPHAFKIEPGQVRAIHFVYDRPLASSTIRHYLAVDDVLRRAEWVLHASVLHVDEGAILPLQLEGHRVTP